MHVPGYDAALYFWRIRIHWLVLDTGGNQTPVVRQDACLWFRPCTELACDNSLSGLLGLLLGRTHRQNPGGLVVSRLRVREGISPLYPSSPYIARLILTYKLGSSGLDTTENDVVRPNIGRLARGLSQSPKRIYNRDTSRHRWFSPLLDDIPHLLVVSTPTSFYPRSKAVGMYSHSILDCLYQG